MTKGQKQLARMTWLIGKRTPGKTIGFNDQGKIVLAGFSYSMFFTRPEARQLARRIDMLLDKWRAAR